MNKISFAEIKSYLPQNTKFSFKEISSIIEGNIGRIIKKNVSFLNGKFPIGFWNYTDLEKHSKIYNLSEIKKWADAGFTIVHGPDFKPDDKKQKQLMIKILNWCNKYGIKVILWDPRCIVKNNINISKYKKEVKKSIFDFGKLPALFGFFLCDEPGYNLMEDVVKSVRIQREIEPKLIPFVNLLPFFKGVEGRIGTTDWIGFLEDYIEKSNTELLSYDCYFQMNPDEEGVKTYFENLRIFREVSLKKGIPFWTTLLCVGHFNYRCPNYDELRWQFNTSLACGANGILWFFYYMRIPHSNYRFSPVNELWELTETYYNLRLIHKNFHQHYRDLFTKLVSRKVFFYPEASGGWSKFNPKESLISQISCMPENHPLLIGEFVDIVGRPYIMLVNNSMKENVYCTITFTGKNIRVFSWDWDGKEYEGKAYSAILINRGKENIRVSHWLAPGQEAVYRVYKK
ncbi:MAG TPA: hypothetical protein PKV21_08970 [bacterium]|nr:hypothetical protein [bacterium]HOM27616.1 hypothetical protein [bacterium]